jgi:hypothetical protein
MRVKNIQSVYVLGVRQHDNSFLKVFEMILRLGQEKLFEVIQFIEYDKSIKLLD